MTAPTILLVDDEPSMLRYTKTVLELNDYKVETAATGEEALERMNRGAAPNLILLDLAMPGMDGLEVLETCKKMRPEQKIVMLSCVNDTNKVVQAIKLAPPITLLSHLRVHSFRAQSDACSTLNPKQWLGLRITRLRARRSSRISKIIFSSSPPVRR